MPRGVLTPSNFSPFGRFIFERFLWRQTPPRSASWLAVQLHISARSVLDWVYGKSHPRPEMLKRLHATIVAHEGDITIEQLFEVAQVNIPDRAAWHDLERVINRENRIPAESRERILAVIREEAAAYHLVKEEKKDEGKDEGIEHVPTYVATPHAKVPIPAHTAVHKR